MLCIETGPLRGEPVDLAIWFAPVPHPTKKKTIFLKQFDFDLIYSTQFIHTKIQNTNNTQHHTSVQVSLGIWNRGFIIRRINFDNPMRKVLREARQVEIIFLVEIIWTINLDDMPSDAGKKKAMEDRG